MRNTWIGSGINSVEIEREFTCRSCHWEGEVVGYTDDYGSMLYAVCPNCKDEMTIDLAIFAVFAVPIYFLMVPRKKK